MAQIGFEFPDGVFLQSNLPVRAGFNLQARHTYFLLTSKISAHVTIQFASVSRANS